MLTSNTTRIKRLAQELEGRGWDAFFAWSPVTMGYLSGFFEGSHERFLSLAIRQNGQFAMIAPALSGSQARRHGIEDLRLWTDQEDPYVLLRNLAAEWNLGSAVVGVDNEMPAHMVLGIQAALPNITIVAGDAAMAVLRRRKEQEELELMLQAGSIADRALPVALSALREGITEREVETILTSEMRRLGGSPTFCCVAFGAGSAEPHHVNGDTALKSGDMVLLDYGCDFRHYQSDITRTVCFGPATEDMKRIYQKVFEAHMSARERIRPGVSCEKIDQAARGVIDAAGYGEQFIHRLGHGIGMQVHEAPYMVAGNLAELEVGNCFSIEPGIYFPEKWGVRIENIVHVTETGHASFNEEPSPNLIEVGA